MSEREAIIYKRDENQTYKIVLSHFAGFASYADLPPSIFRKVHAVLVVYDPTNLDSVKEVLPIIEYSKEKIGEHCLPVVVSFKKSNSKQKDIDRDVILEHLGPDFKAETWS